MRINYFRFPSGTSEATLLTEGCGVILKSGTEIFPSSIPDDKRELVDRVNDTLSGLSVTHVKDLIKKYGGCGWTCHFERDGGLFETTEIAIGKNNSNHHYNRHL